MTPRAVKTDELLEPSDLFGVTAGFGPPATLRLTAVPTAHCTAVLKKVLSARATAMQPKMEKEIGKLDKPPTNRLRVQTVVRIEDYIALRRLFPGHTSL